MYTLLVKLIYEYNREFLSNQLNAICYNILMTPSLLSPRDSAALALYNNSLSRVLAVFSCLYIYLSID